MITDDDIIAAMMNGSDNVESLLEQQLQEQKASMEIQHKNMLDNIKKEAIIAGENAKQQMLNEMEQNIKVLFH